RMVTGFVPPTEGRVTVGGFDMVENPLPGKRLIGYLPENAPAYNDMTVEGFLSFAAELRGLRGEEKKKAVHRVVEMCFLDSVLHQSIETLSKGYRHRTCFAQSVLHDPDVLILDEPTDGLDPNQKQEVRNLIRQMGKKKAIIFSTHILEEVEAVCSRVITIDRGHVVADGTPQELKQRSDLAGAVTLCVTGVAGNAVSQKLSPLPQVRKTVIVKEEVSGVVVRAFPKANGAGRDLAGGVALVCAQEGWKILELHTEEGRLDEVFRSITLPETVQEAK